MPTFLLTWNPARWEWKNLQKLAARSIRGERIKDRWSTGSRKNISPGDRFFLLQQGDHGRGIIGAGEFTSGVVQGPHYARDGDSQNEAAVVFDRLVDPFNQPERRFDVSDLRKLPGSSDVFWNAQGGGIELPDALADAIEKAWGRRRELGFPDGVTRADVLDAIARLKRGAKHSFDDSTRWDVLFEGERFPTKAVGGLAAERALGRKSTPYDFKAGRGSKLHRVLEDLGFEIVPKAAVDSGRQRELANQAPSAEAPGGSSEDRQFQNDDTFDDLISPDFSALGSDSPTRSPKMVSGVKRDPAVRRAVAKRAKGKCEWCGEHRQFPGFIDVHHIFGAEKSDRVWTCVALCPNCHREAHYSPEKDAIDRALRRIADAYRPS